MNKGKRNRRKASSTARKRGGIFEVVLAPLKKRLRLLLVSFGLVLATTILFFAFYLFQVFKNNLTLASGGLPPQKENLDTGKTFNLLVFEVEDLQNQTSSITSAAILNFQVEKKLLNVLSLPVEAELNNWWGAGKVRFSALYGLSNLTTESKKMEKLVSLEVGLPVDGVFFTDTKNLESLGSSFKDITNASGPLTLLRNLPGFGTKIKTNLNLMSLTGLIAYLAFHSPNKTETFSLNSWRDLPQWDSIFRDKFSDPEVTSERLKVIVINGTRKGGLAGRVGNLLSNLGLTLLAVQNSPEGELYQNSILLTKSEDYYSAKRIASFLSVNDVRSAATLSDDPKFDRLLRADLVLLAGADLFDN